MVTVHFRMSRLTDGSARYHRIVHAGGMFQLELATRWRIKRVLLCKYVVEFEVQIWRNNGGIAIYVVLCCSSLVMVMWFRILGISQKIKV